MLSSSSSIWDQEPKPDLISPQLCLLCWLYQTSWQRRYCLLLNLQKKSSLPLNLNLSQVAPRSHTSNGTNITLHLLQVIALGYKIWKKREIVLRSKKEENDLEFSKKKRRGSCWSFPSGAVLGWPTTGCCTNSTSGSTGPSSRWENYPQGENTIRPIKHSLH